MYACLLNKPIELYHSTTYFAIFYISLQIFNNVMETPDRARVGVNSGVGVGVGFNSNSNSGVGVGNGVETSGVGVGVGVDTMELTPTLDRAHVTKSMV